MTTYTKEKLQEMLVRAKEELEAASDRACITRSTWKLMQDDVSYVAWQEANEYATDCAQFVFDIQTEIDSLSKDERN